MWHLKLLTKLWAELAENCLLIRISENIRKLSKSKPKKNGISNSENYNYRITTKNNIEIKPEGGIGISDFKEFNEIIIESAGIDLKIFDN